MRIFRPLFLLFVAVQICLAQNAALQGYTWKSKTQVEVNGQVRKVMVSQVRMGPDGQLQKTALTSPDVSAQPPSGPLRQRLANRKAEKAQDWIDGLRNTLEPYSTVPKDKMKAFLMAGKLTPMGNGVVQIVGTGLVTPGDQVTVTADMASREPKSMQVNTSYDNVPLQLNVDLGEVAPGVNAPQKITISVPDHNIDIVTENYDYQAI